MLLTLDECFPLSGEEYYTSMLEEMEIEGRDFEADSWSMAVDSGYLQTHRKDIIKRQDVIYGESSDMYLNLFPFVVKRP